MKVSRKLINPVFTEIRAWPWNNNHSKYISVCWGSYLRGCVPWIIVFVNIHNIGWDESYSYRDFFFPILFLKLNILDLSTVHLLKQTINDKSDWSQWGRFSHFVILDHLSADVSEGVMATWIWALLIIFPSFLQNLDIS